MTNKAVVWRALSKPPQRRQGPDPRPLWLLIGTPSAFGPEFAYRLRVAQPTLMDVPRYFWYHIYVCVPNCYDLSALVCCWSLVSIRSIIYKFSNVCPSDYTAAAVSGKVGISLTGLTTPVEWLSLPQLTVLNRCVIDVFVAFYVSRCFLGPSHRRCGSPIVITLSVRPSVCPHFVVTWYIFVTRKVFDLETSYTDGG